MHVNVVGSIRPVLADSARIEQVLGNLLSNAVKYGDPDSEIMVEVRQQDHEAMVKVTNRGPGIPADEVANIFTRFYRTRQARAGPTEGLGLGLYITKGIVEAHHGQMSVESIPGQTTSFSFTLPLAAAAIPRRAGGYS
jgi:signal transduction histidine kinase